MFKFGEDTVKRVRDVQAAITNAETTYKDELANISKEVALRTEEFRSAAAKYLLNRRSLNNLKLLSLLSDHEFLLDISMLKR